jgi:VWFA-related protein
MNPRRAIRQVVLLAASGCLLAPAPAPSAGAVGEPDRRQRTFAATIDAVRLDVVVTGGGRVVPGLEARDFDVLDNGVPQKPILVARGDAVTVLPVLDTSESVAGDRLQELAIAARTLVDLLHTDDCAGLLTFSNRPLLRVPPVHGGLDQAAITAEIGRLRPGGLTAMYDALSVGLMLAAPDAGSSLLLLFSDGADTSSYLTPDAVLDSVRRAGVVVYVVATGLPAPGTGQAWVAPDRHEQFLQSVVDSSGGRLVRAEFSRRRLGEAFTRVLNEFRTRYVLAYIPEGVGRTDGWHTLKVSLKPNAFDAGVAPRGTVVRVRAGYYATGPAGAPGAQGREPRAESRLLIVQRGPEVP